MSRLEYGGFYSKKKVRQNSALARPQPSGKGFKTEAEGVRGYPCMNMNMSSVISLLAVDCEHRPGQGTFKLLFLQDV
jgi:hypothetical protein